MIRVTVFSLSLMLVAPAMAETSDYLLSMLSREPDASVNQLVKDIEALRHVAVMSNVELLRLKLGDEKELGDEEYLNRLIARERTTSTARQELELDFEKFNRVGQNTTPAESARWQRRLMEAQAEHKAVLLELNRILREKIQELKREGEKHGEEPNESRLQRMQKHSDVMQEHGAVTRITDGFSRLRRRLDRKYKHEACDERRPTAAF